MAPKKTYYLMGHEPVITPPFVTDALVGHWDAGDPASYPGSGTDWLDLTTNSNDGILTNGATYSASGGDHIECDGDNDYVDLGSISSVNPLSLAGQVTFSIEFWINPNASGDDFQRILEKGSGGVSSGGYGLLMRPSVNGIILTIDGSSAGSTMPYYNGWSQVVITRNSSNSLNFYQNGAMYSGGLLTKAIPSTTTTMRLGTWAALSGREYSGSIGALRIYSKDLSSAEISTNYNQLKGRYGLS